MPEEIISSEIEGLLPELGPQPAAVADRLKVLADAGDDQAVVLAAWSLLQAGRWQEGIPYAERAAELGSVQIVANYAGNMIGTPEHREKALSLLRAAMEGGWQVDPLGWLPTVVGQNDTAAAGVLIDLATSPPWPRLTGGRIDTLVDRLTKANETFESHAADVERAKTNAVTNIESGEKKVNEEVKRLSSLGHKVETLAHEAASDELSRQYSDQAKRNERAAFWFELLAIAVFVAAVAVAAYFTLTHVNDTPDLAEGLAKAGVSIPIALLALFLERLATRFRQMAWRWRHVELQLRTAEPYIAELDEQRRMNLIETLALRFFPGQPLDISGGSGPEAPSSPIPRP